MGWEMGFWEDTKREGLQALIYQFILITFSLLITRIREIFVLHQSISGSFASGNAVLFVDDRPCNHYFRGVLLPRTDFPMKAAVSWLKTAQLLREGGHLRILFGNTKHNISPNQSFYMFADLPGEEQMLSDPKIIFGLCPIPYGCVKPSSASSAVSTKTTASSTARSICVMGFPGDCSLRRKSADHFCLRCRAR